MDAAEDGGTVTVLQDGLEASMSGSSRSITLENGTNTQIKVTINGTEYTITAGGTQVITYTASSSSGGSSTRYTVSVPSGVEGRQGRRILHLGQPGQHRDHHGHPR